MSDAWLHHRNTHAHIVHPSPVRAHSYPFHAYGAGAELGGGTGTGAPSGSGYYGSSLESPPSSSTLHHPFASSSSNLYSHRPLHLNTHHLHHADPYQQQQSTFSSSYSQYSYSHSSGGGGFRESNLPSPPLSTSAMPPDPWNSGASDRMTSPSDDGANHDWTNGHSNNHYQSGKYDDYTARNNDTTSPSSHQHKHIIPPMGPMIRTSSHKTKPLKRLPAPYMLETWASLMDKSKGRDKVLVCTPSRHVPRSADLFPRKQSSTPFARTSTSWD